MRHAHTQQNKSSGIGDTITLGTVCMYTAIKKDERKVVSKEPRINNNNHQRGDIQVEVAAGGQEDNVYFGVGDITVKSVLGVHTANSRANARAAAELLGQEKLHSTRG